MAKSTTSNISIRMDSDLKAAAEALYEELGMNQHSFQYFCPPVSPRKRNSFQNYRRNSK